MRAHANDAVAPDRRDRTGRSTDVVDARRGVLRNVHVLVADGDCRFPGQGVGILRNPVGNRAVALAFLP